MEETGAPNPLAGQMAQLSKDDLLRGKTEQ